MFTVTDKFSLCDCMTTGMATDLTVPRSVSAPIVGF